MFHVSPMNIVVKNLVLGLCSLCCKNNKIKNVTTKGQIAK